MIPEKTIEDYYGGKILRIEKIRLKNFLKRSLEIPEIQDEKKAKKNPYFLKTKREIRKARKLASIVYSLSQISLLDDNGCAFLSDFAFSFSCLLA